MQKSRLWEALLTFTATERKHLGRWVNSPFFNRNERPIRLFGYLEKCLSEQKAPDKIEAHQAIFPQGKKYNDAQMRLVISELYRLLEHYLVYAERFAQPENYPADLATAFRKRNLERHFQKAVQKAEKMREAQTFRHAEHLSGSFQVAFEKYQHQSAGRRVEDFNLQKLSDLADTAFIAQKLRLTCIALSHQTVYRADYDLGMLEAVLAEVRRRGLEAMPAIGLYYFGYLLIAEPGVESHFAELKKMMLNQSKKLPKEEQRNLYLMALNYCIKKVNALNERFYREVFDLYLFALENELLLERGVLSHFAFNNVVAIALKVGEVEWAEGFVKKYTAKLERKHRNSTSNLNLARVEYVRKNFDQALLHLQLADYRDRINSLITKTLQLKIFYELGEYDVAEAHLNALNTFIRRQRVMGYHRTNYLNMVRHARSLLNLTPGDEAERESLQRRIVEEEILTERDWLLGMLE